MNTKFQTIKSVAYMCIWIFLAFGGWFLWLSALHFIIDIGEYTFIIVFGLVIGIISGLSPLRAFLVCFCGFFIIALLIGFYFFIFEDLVLFGILCGLFATAGAIIRRMVTHQKLEELYLKPWQWVLLICGVTILADYIVVLGMYRQLFVYYHVFIFIQFLVPTLICLFASGVYTGTFSQLEYDELSKFVITVSCGGHICFLAYMLFLRIVRYTSWKSFMMIPLIGMYLLVLYKGAKVGFRLRNREFIRKLQ